MLLTASYMLHAYVPTVSACGNLTENSAPVEGTSIREIQRRRNFYCIVPTHVVCRITDEPGRVARRLFYRAMWYIRMLIFVLHYVNFYCHNEQTVALIDGVVITPYFHLNAFLLLPTNRKKFHLHSAFINPYVLLATYYSLVYAELEFLLRRSFLQLSFCQLEI